MAQLPPDITKITNQLKQQSLNVIHEATKVELILIDSFGETKQTLPYLDEMKKCFRGSGKSPLLTINSTIADCSSSTLCSICYARVN